MLLYSTRILPARAMAPKSARSVLMKPSVSAGVVMRGDAPRIADARGAIPHKNCLDWSTTICDRDTLKFVDPETKSIGLSSPILPTKFKEAFPGHPIVVLMDNEAAYQSATFTIFVFCDFAKEIVKVATLRVEANRLYQSRQF